MKTKLLALFALLGLAFNFAAQAEVQSGIVGDTKTIEVGKTAELIDPPTLPVPSQPGLPGIGHIDVAEGKLISFETLQSVGQANSTGGSTNWEWTTLTPDQPNNPHGDIGY